MIVERHRQHPTLRNFFMHTKLNRKWSAMFAALMLTAFAAQAEDLVGETDTGTYTVDAIVPHELDGKTGSIFELTVALNETRPVPAAHASGTFAPRDSLIYTERFQIFVQCRAPDHSLEIVGHVYMNRFSTPIGYNRSSRGQRMPATEGSMGEAIFEKVCEIVAAEEKADQAVAERLKAKKTK